jgi:WD40-like Beta Propeller Repeat
MMSGSRSLAGSRTPADTRERQRPEPQHGPVTGLAAAVLSLQTEAGNAAVAAALARRAGAPFSLQRQQVPVVGDAAAPASEPVSLEGFLTSGTALNGQQLGFKALSSFWMNAVELRFALGAAPQQYRDLRPRQYSGTEAVWIKRGNPFEPPWINISQGPGGNDIEPDWSPDGQKLVFVRTFAYPDYAVFSVKVDGTGEQQLRRDLTATELPQWSPVGDKILYEQNVGLTVAEANGENPQVIHTGGLLAYDWRPNF